MFWLSTCAEYGAAVLEDVDGSGAGSGRVVPTLIATKPVDSKVSGQAGHAEGSHDADTGPLCRAQWHVGCQWLTTTRVQQPSTQLLVPKIFFSVSNVPQDVSLDVAVLPPLTYTGKVTRVRCAVVEDGDLACSLVKKGDASVKRKVGHGAVRWC